MGIFIHLAISKSVTRKEWNDVYQETLQLVKAFPLAEVREVSVRGIPTRCMVPTVEREDRWGWPHEKIRTGWFSIGDYDRLRTAEEYHLLRDLVSEDDFEEDAPDALLESAPQYLADYDWNDSRFNHNYSLWGAKTQGEPYHMYLLAIACMIESRLGQKAYVFGDITKGQCERAVRMANEHLDQKICTPDRCDKDRLLARISNLAFTEIEKLHLFTGMYLGRKDSEFGKSIRNHFSEQTCNVYWEKRFQRYQISMRGFDSVLEDYLMWGFDLEKMCSFVQFKDDEGNAHYEDFVERIMDAKLHQRDKDCTDLLDIDPDSEEPYGIGILFAQITFGAARNRKIDRYIPVEDIKTALSRAIGDYCPVNELIDTYLQEERAKELPDLSGKATDEDYQKAVEQDPSYAFTEVMNLKMRSYEEMYKKYDVVRSEELPYYKAGDTMHPNLMEAVGKSFAFYRSMLEEDTYKELMTKEPTDRCRWLASKNRYVLLRDTEWEKIFDDIKDYPESFARYYPMVRVKVSSEGLQGMVRAFVANDALYSYAMKLEAGLV